MFAACFATWQMPFQMSSPQGEGKDTLYQQRQPYPGNTHQQVESAFQT